MKTTKVGRFDYQRLHGDEFTRRLIADVDDATRHLENMVDVINTFHCQDEYGQNTWDDCDAAADFLKEPKS